MLTQDGKGKKIQMNQDFIIGASLLVNAGALAIAFLIRSSPRNKRRLAAALLASAKAQEQKTAAWAKIETEARNYEDILLRRAEGEEPRLYQIGE